MWVVLDRIVQLTFLILAITIICLLLNTSQEEKQSATLSIMVEEVRESFKKVMSSNLFYLENKINKVAQGQDDYQVVMSRKIEILDMKVEMMEKENKDLKTQNKTINYNNSSAVINK